MMKDAMLTFLLHYVFFRICWQGWLLGARKSLMASITLIKVMLIVLSLAIESLPRTSELKTWHNHVGHPNFDYMSQMFPSLCSNKDASDFYYDSCKKAKYHRTSFPKMLYQACKPFSTIHSDLWGPSRTPNQTHSKWFITSIDNHTRVSWVYLLKYKIEVYPTFLNFHNMIRTQF